MKRVVYFMWLCVALGCNSQGLPTPEATPTLTPIVAGDQFTLSLHQPAPWREGTTTGFSCYLILNRPGDGPTKIKDHSLAEHEYAVTGTVEFFDAAGKSQGVQETVYVHEC